MRIASDFITRPNNTTLYTTGDVMTNAVGAVLRFGTNDIFGSILSAILVDSVVAGGNKPECDLLLYSAPPDIAADNDAFAPTDAQATKLVASIPFLAANFKAAVANGHVVSAITAPVPFLAPDRVLYGVLVYRDVGPIELIVGEAFKPTCQTYVLIADSTAPTVRQPSIKFSKHIK